MLLSWSDKTGIARALHEAYPDTDRLALSMDDLMALLDGLPQLPPAPVHPPEKFLRSILWTWMRVADGEEERCA